MRQEISAIALGVLLAGTVAVAPDAKAQGGPSGPGGAAASKPVVTSEQRARLTEKLRLVDQIARSVDPDMQANAIPAEGRRWLMERLYGMPLEQLKSLGVPGSFKAASDAVAKSKPTAKLLGASQSDVVYRPITACRFIDTRFALGPLSGTPRTYDLDAVGNTYGGSAACNPVSASGVVNADAIAAIAVNVAIVSPTVAPGFLGARAAFSTNNTSFVNWYQAGAGVQASNAGVITTFQGAGDEIEFFGSSTQFIVDIFGVFTAPDATPLDCLNPSTFQTTVSVPANTVSNFEYSQACTTGYTSVGGSCYTDASGFSPGVMYLQAQGPSSDNSTYFCLYRNLDTVSHSMFIWNKCCRIP